MQNEGGKVGLEVDKVQNDFLSTLRSCGKLNHVIAVEEHAYEVEGKIVLAFHVPEAQRREKPVYLKGDIRRSYIRRGGGDERCTEPEIERFLRDAAGTAYDRELLQGIDVEDAFDESTVAWYRHVLQDNQGDRHAGLADVEFLNEWGFVVESDDALVATRAGVLLFGKERYVRQILPRAVVDYQRIDVPSEDWDATTRWHDRLVVEGNILHAWQVLAEKYIPLAETPFSIDEATLRRHDAPADYISFREAAINLLIHQDYGDHTRMPVLRVFSDQMLFWNPGDAFVEVGKLLDPGAKEVRNPIIVAAFRRIGLSDQAGTGIRAIMANWGGQGYVPPIIINNKADKEFELRLVKEPLLSEQQRIFQAQLGVSLSDPEAAVFAYACRSEEITSTDLKTLVSNRDAPAVIDRLVVQGLLNVLEDQMRWQLATHLREALLAGDQPMEATAGLVSDQPNEHVPRLVTQIMTNLTNHQRGIIGLCEAPRRQAELMENLGVTHRTFFSRKHLSPLLAANLIRMTHPERPNHPDQSYVLTENGLGLLMSWNENKTEESQG